MEPGQIVLAPIVSEKSYGGTADGKYTFRVHSGTNTPSRSSDKIRCRFTANTAFP